MHIHTLRHTPPFSQSAYTNSKPKITWNNAFSVKPKRKNSQIKQKSLETKAKIKRGWQFWAQHTCNDHNWPNQNSHITPIRNQSSIRHRFLVCTFLLHVSRGYHVSESDVYRAQPTRTTTFYLLLKSDRSHFFEERSSGRNQDCLCWRRTRLKHNWSNQKYNALIVLNQTNLLCSHKFILRRLWTREPASLAFDDEQNDLL